MKSSATTVKDYLAGLPGDRRAAISTVRDLVNRNLPAGLEESIAYGMIAWAVPLTTYPDTYNGQPLMYAALASQKQYMAIYLMGVSGGSPSAREFQEAFAKAGKKLDKGKSCVRFRALEDLHLPAIGRAIGCCTVDEYVRRAKAAHSPEARKARREKSTNAGAKAAKRPAKKAASAGAAKKKPPARTSSAGRKASPARRAKQKAAGR